MKSYCRSSSKTTLITRKIDSFQIVWFYFLNEQIVEIKVFFLILRSTLLNERFVIRNIL
jgi:hypothetical protein